MRRIKFFDELLDVEDPRDNYYSFLLAPEVEPAGLLATHFLVVGSGPFQDEALLFEEKLKRVGRVKSSSLPLSTLANTLLESREMDIYTQE